MNRRRRQLSGSSSRVLGPRHALRSTPWNQTPEYKRRLALLELRMQSGQVWPQAMHQKQRKRGLLQAPPRWEMQYLL